MDYGRLEDASKRYTRPFPVCIKGVRRLSRTSGPSFRAQLEHLLLGKSSVPCFIQVFSPVIVSHYSFQLPTLNPFLPVPIFLHSCGCLKERAESLTLQSMALAQCNAQQVTMDCLSLHNSGQLGGLCRYHSITLLENIVFQMSFQIYLALRRGRTVKVTFKGTGLGCLKL